MNPQRVFCPNMECPARGQQDKGNIRVHARQEKRYLCHECQQTFAATKRTILYRLKTGAATVMLVVTRLAYGCPLPAIVKAFGFDKRTVKTWWQRAGNLFMNRWSKPVKWNCCRYRRMKSRSRRSMALSGWLWR
jgi:transposase-like protein